MFVIDRLTAAAEVFELKMAGYEDEVLHSKSDVRSKLPGVALKPGRKLPRADPLDVCEGEVPPEQQERSPSLGREEPEPRQSEDPLDVCEEEVPPSSRRGAPVWAGRNQSPNGVKVQYSLGCCRPANLHTFCAYNHTVGQNTKKFTDPPHVSEEEVVHEGQQEEPEAPEETWTYREGEQLECPEEADAEDSTFTLTLSQSPQPNSVENREGEPLPSTSAEQMETEADEEDCGLSQPTTDCQYLSAALTRDTENERKERGGPELRTKKLRAVKRQSSRVRSKSRTSEPFGHRQVTCPDGLEPEKDDGDNGTDRKERGEPRKGFKTKKMHAMKGKSSAVPSKRQKSTVESSHPKSHGQDASQTYRCDVCGKEFKRSRHMLAHTRIHTGDKLHACAVCGKHFTELSQLAKHSTIHTGEKPYKCTVCDKEFRLKFILTSHMNTHTGDKSHTCNICNMKFSARSNLTRHMRVHTGEKPYRCSTCSQSFTQSTHLKVHMGSHMEEKPYSCTVCGKGFIQIGHLNIHERIHAGEKPHGCTECEKSFISNSELTKHVRIHTGEKPYSCGVCSRTFGHRSSLSHHMKLHRGERPHRCGVCGKAFTRPSFLRDHMTSHTADKLYRCSICNKAIKHKQNLIGHMRTHRSTDGV